MTSRELVYKTVEFENHKNRAPRILGVLPWATDAYPDEYKALVRDYPADIIGAAVTYKEKDASEGNPYVIGDSTDGWGCRFTNIHKGVHGQVKESLLPNNDDGWDDTSRVHIPVEWLSFEIEDANRFCASTDKFVLAGCCPRPFEQLQFIRGTEQLFIDIALRPDGFIKFIKKMHQFYCELLEKWAKTDVDALQIMDDWGSQRDLLISPDTWVEIFKPLYKDYIDIAHRHGKKIHMHSDGYTLALFPHLIELGLDTYNAQLFCMDINQLGAYKGQITFWGEIDRQHLLSKGTLADIDEAVTKVYDTLWLSGGCIAHCEFGPVAKPENIRQVFACWDKLTGAC